MKNISRLVAAAVLVGVLVVVAGGVWAAPVFRGTVDSVPKEGSNVPPPAGGGATENPIDMGTAIFTPTCTNCKVDVTLVSDPAALAPAPAGLAFLGDTFEVKIDQADGTVKICYAYPPELVAKNAKIHKLNTETDPVTWVEVPGATISNGVICVTSGAGIFSLIGNP